MADYVSTLTGPQMDAALLDMAEHNSEAYAVGERNGIAVAPDDVTYHNNARYYAQIASSQIVGDASSAVRWDTDQSEALTSAQKAVARNNIGAASDSDVVKITAQTLTSAQQSQARANIMAGGTNPNLLDNAYFVGGGSQLGDGVFPINQRGLTYYESIGDYFDRWKSNSPWASPIKCALQSEGVVLAGDTTPSYPTAYTQLSQVLASPPVGKTVTLSILTDSVTPDSEGDPPFLYTNDSGWTPITVGLTSVTFVWASGVTQIGIILPNGATTAASLRMQAIKLEVGSVSTIQNDAPPDFGEELRKCQRYFVRFSPKVNSRAYIGTGSANNSNNMLIFVPTPVTLRTTPTISYSNCNCYNWVVGGSIALNGINLDSWSDNGVFVSCAPSDTSQAPQGQPYALRVASGGFFDLSCEP